MANDASALATQICNQIATVFSTNTTPSPLNIILAALTTAATNNRRIFVIGVGRELLMLKSLCMRLVHLGLSAYVVGDVTTPPIRPNDLLIASAGPGSFSTVEAICRVARAELGIVLYLTSQPDNCSCKELASEVVYLPARTMADDDGGEREREVLPMGSLYEGAMFVLFEMVVYRLSDVLGESPRDIAARHTNLE